MIYNWQCLIGVFVTNYMKLLRISFIANVLLLRDLISEICNRPLILNGNITKSSSFWLENEKNDTILFFNREIYWRNLSDFDQQLLPFQAWFGTPDSTCKSWNPEPSDKCLTTIDNFGAAVSCLSENIGLYCLEPVLYYKPR